MKKADIGIIGGSGFYEFLQGKEVEVTTPYGAPADKILLSQVNGKTIAFLPRHGKTHHLPPHKINYKANLFALKELGVGQILALSAVGSLKPEIKPGYFVISDQFIDKTKQRKDTFFEGGIGNKVAHISMAEPYCPKLRDIIIKSCENIGIDFHKQGTVVVIEGPRFSTKAESAVYQESGDIINMTQYPEVALARELELCYANISLVTDYDAGLKDNQSIEPANAKQVIDMFQANIDKLKQIVLRAIKSMAENSPVVDCSCNQALKNALI